MSEAPDGTPVLLAMLWESDAAAALERGRQLFPGHDPDRLRVEEVRP